MMNITKKAITDDIAFITQTLKKSDVEIPSFLSCATPDIVLMLGMTLWQFFIAFPVAHDDKMLRLFSKASVGFSFVLGFFIFLMLTSSRGKYLSLPIEIRDQSLIIRLIKHKTMFYAGLWVFLNLAAGLSIKLFDISAIFSYVTQFASALFLWFIALADLGRYDLAVFGSVIKAWRDGDKLDPEQLKRLDI